MVRCGPKWGNAWKILLASALLTTGVLGGDVLQTNGFTDCGTDASIKVERMNIQYDNKNKTVVFDVAGENKKRQNVTASIKVTAYGNNVYSNSFNPCDAGTFIAQLCPLPSGNFSAKGSQPIPPQFANMIPAIAFSVPDIAAQAQLELTSLNTGRKVACIQAQVTNGKTVSVPAVSIVAAGVASIALVVSGVSAAGAALSGGGAAIGGSAAGGGATISPGFTEVFGWFQGMAMNGMLSVNYPPVYRSFTKNFAFSAGIIPWTGLQTSIDSFRAKTGGNLTQDSVAFLRNATLVYPDGSTTTPQHSTFKVKRAMEAFMELATRGIETSVNSTASGDEKSQTKLQLTVTGIEAYAQQLSVPKSNTFMTALLVVAIIIASIALGILLVKVVLEIWALFGNFPKSLAGFRKHYWGSIARTITSLIFLLYGVWVLYCVFQFTRGDSWAAKALAGVTLALFTGVLAFFSYKIWSTAKKLKAAEGDANALYNDKSIWVKYSLFYESYRKNYWWIFVPTIFYMFSKGFVLAAADGKGMIQTIGQLIIEAIMLVLLVWSRPYERKSGNVINIVIQVVRVLSVVCILVFVEEFGIAQTTQTVTGVVLIAVQSTLTGVLTILLVWNGINACCKANPHRQRRKDMEKYNNDADDLTPLDARNSLLLVRTHTRGSSMFSMASTMEKPIVPVPIPSDHYYTAPDVIKPPVAPSGGPLYRSLTPSVPARNLAPNPNANVIDRQPTLPSVERPYQGNYGQSYGYSQSGYGNPYR